jgi:Ca-activated chloride channel family protein
MLEERDEAKLTAYVLGELDDKERSRLQAVLGASADARRDVGEIEETSASLRAALAQPALQELTSAQRARIEAAAVAEPLTLARPRRSRWLLWTAVSAAAAVVLAVSIPSLLRARVAPRAMPMHAVVLPTSAPTAQAAPALERAPAPPAFAFRSVPAGPAPAKLRQELKALGYLEADAQPGDPVHEALDFRRRSAPFNTEAYNHIRENPFVLVAQDPRSTFSIDVDTASYSLVRRFLNNGQLPPQDAVRIEELVNYFPYAYEPPSDGRPFAVHMDVAECPWKPAHRLVRIAIKGRELPDLGRPASNLVFLLDVSGSMDAPNKLPLVQAAMRLLVNTLEGHDRVAIVVYAGAAGLVLPSTPGDQKSRIFSAIESLSPEGSTHGSAGIRLAYDVALQNFIKGGVNRVILATDGDFNVGVTNHGDLVQLIEEKRQSGVFLTALGFGMGNLKDGTLQKLANHGNGSYAYIDGLSEARKVLVEQAGATLVTIAKDVKLQLEFNPRKVKAFRLIGYEKRVLAHQDFNDDKKDAGEIGAGHTVTALYEIVPPGVEIPIPGVDALKYQEPARPATTPSEDLLTLKLRYKEPDGMESTALEVALEDRVTPFASAPDDFRFAAAVAAFGMALRESPHKGATDFAKVLEWARPSRTRETSSLRSEFAALVKNAETLARSR